MQGLFELRPLLYRSEFAYSFHFWCELAMTFKLAKNRPIGVFLFFI